MHVPEVECWAKGKAHRPYEFGVKVSGHDSEQEFYWGIHVLAGNPYDGHTLASQLEQVESLTGPRPRRCLVDQGYRGHEVDLTQTKVGISRQRRSLTRAFATGVATTQCNGTDHGSYERGRLVWPKPPEWPLGRQTECPPLWSGAEPPSNSQTPENFLAWRCQAPSRTSMVPRYGFVLLF